MSLRAHIIMNLLSLALICSSCFHDPHSVKNFENAQPSELTRVDGLLFFLIGTNISPPDCSLTYSAVIQRIQQSVDCVIDREINDCSDDFGRVSIHFDRGGSKNIIEFNFNDIFIFDMEFEGDNISKYYSAYKEDLNQNKQYSCFDGVLGRAAATSHAIGSAAEFNFIYIHDYKNGMIESVVDSSAQNRLSIVYNSDGLISSVLIEQGDGGDTLGFLGSDGQEINCVAVRDNSRILRFIGEKCPSYIIHDR